MKKKELCDLLAKYPDDADVFIEEMEYDGVIEGLGKVRYGWYVTNQHACPPVEITEDEQKAINSGVKDKPKVIVLSI